MKTSTALSLLAPLLLLAGCSGRDDAAFQERTKEWSARMETNLSRLEDRIAGLQSNFTNVFEFLGDQFAVASRFAEIDTTDHSYGRVGTDLGVMLVSCENIEGYLDGYRLHLVVGNPLAATLHTPRLTVEWAKVPSVRNGETNLLWKNRKVFTLTTPLEPGKWNTNEVVLAPAKADDVRQIQVSLDIGTVSLRR